MFENGLFRVEFSKGKKYVYNYVIIRCIVSLYMKYIRNR